MRKYFNIPLLIFAFVLGLFLAMCGITSNDWLFWVIVIPSIVVLQVILNTVNNRKN